jgi:hypothetical protein
MKHRARRLVWVAGAFVAVALGIAIWWNSSDPRSVQLGGPRQSNEVATESPAGPRSSMLALQARQEMAPAEVVPAGAVHGPVRIRGLVTDAQWPPYSGTPLPVPSLLVQVSLGGSAHSASTDVEGRFEFLLDGLDQRPLAGSVSVPASKHRLAVAREFELLDGQSDIEVLLERPAHGRVEGRVVDPDGNPLANVRIEFTQEDARIETVSDAAGRFSAVVLPFDDWELDAGVPGTWRLWSHTILGPRGGGYEFLELTLMRSGSIEVLVEDGEGKPAKGVTVGLSLVQDELWQARDVVGTSEKGAILHIEKSFLQIPASSETVVTGEDGLALFPEVWSERNLIVRAKSSSNPERMAEHHSHNLLLFSKVAESSESIRVAAGRLLRLRAQPFGLHRTIRGHVRFADGRAVPEPAVFVTALGRPEGEGFATRTNGAEDGSFELVLEDVRAGEQLFVRASDGKVFNEFRTRHAASATLLVGNEDLLADFVLVETLSITGHVVGAGGRPVAGRVYAASGGPSTYVHGKAIRQDGSFEIARLDPGTYELRVEPAFSPGESHVFPGIVAGTSGVTLTIPDPARIALGIRLTAPSAVADACLLVAKAEEEQEGVGRFRPPPASWSVSSVGWPDGIGQKSVGGGTFSVEGIRFRSRHAQLVSNGKWLFARDEPERRWLDLAPGCYVLGMSAWDAEGRPFAAVLSEPASFTEGEYAVAFELVPTGSARIHVEAAAATSGFELVALGDDGQRLPLFLGQSPAMDAVRLVGEGTLGVDRLPVGPVILRVGTPRDLERGSFEIEQRAEIRAGETAELALRW